MSEIDDLLRYIFDGQRPALYPEFERWIRGSRRFRAFALTYRGKVRAKLRQARDQGGLMDVRAELETAALLLREERFTLEYERYAALRLRGPDLTVTFKTHTPFNVEVRRVRSSEIDAESAEARKTKLTLVVCDKVRQMPPSIANLLWLTGEHEVLQAELLAAVSSLRQLAEHKVEAFFTRRGFESATHFLRQYGQLSGIVLHSAGKNELWLNPLARHKAPPEIVTAIQRLETKQSVLP